MGKLNITCAHRHGQFSLKLGRHVAPTGYRSAMTRLRGGSDQRLDFAFQILARNQIHRLDAVGSGSLYLSVLSRW
jgi:hypothetical protein